MRQSLTSEKLESQNNCASYSQLGKKDLFKNGLPEGLVSKTMHYTDQKLTDPDANPKRRYADDQDENSSNPKISDQIKQLESGDQDFQGEGFEPVQIVVNKSGSPNPNTPLGVLINTPPDTGTILDDETDGNKTPLVDKMRANGPARSEQKIKEEVLKGDRETSRTGEWPKNPANKFILTEEEKEEELKVGDAELPLLQQDLDFEVQEKNAITNTRALDQLLHSSK